MASDKWPRPLRGPRDSDDPRRQRGQAGPADDPDAGQPGQIRRGGDPQYGNGPPPGDRRNVDGPAGDARYTGGPAADPRYARRPAGDPRYRSGPAQDVRYGDGRAPQGRYGDGPAPMDARHGDGQVGASRYDARAGDPRFGPRLPQDPRLAPDAHLAGDARFPPDPRLAADPRFAAEAQRRMDPRFAADPRRADPRLTRDPRLAADPSMAADPRVADPRVADPRIAVDAWFGRGPAGQASDPRGLPQRGVPQRPGPQGSPPRAIETRRLAIEAPRAEPLGHTDPLSRTDPLRTAVPTGDAGHPNPGAGGAIGIVDPLRLIDPRRSAVLREAGLRAAAGPPPQADRQRPLGENTRSVRLPVPAPPSQQPLAMPIYRTAAFGFGSSAEYAAVLSGAAPGFSYSRIDNPTVEAFCAAVAALEGVNLTYQAASQAFASGMAAVSTIFWAFARAG